MIRDSETASPNHASPDVNQRIPVYKENFIPPELSIWDYFIAKVCINLRKLNFILLKMWRLIY